MYCIKHDRCFYKECPDCAPVPDALKSIKIGDIVHLKCGGADMVVSETEVIDNILHVTCYWHDKRHNLSVSLYDSRVLEKKRVFEIRPKGRIG